jgi:hypothetical protein
MCLQSRRQGDVAATAYRQHENQEQKREKKSARHVITYEMHLNIHQK